MEIPHTHSGEATGDEKARAKAEDAERTRWAKKVFSLLTEAALPFGTEAEHKGWSFDSPEATRCLRGLRATTLKKRVSDFGPFSRYLRAEVGRPFPTSEQEVLDYFALRLRERAARSCFRSLLLSLHFFEEAGEVLPARRLSSSSALVI